MKRFDSLILSLVFAVLGAVPAYADVIDWDPEPAASHGVPAALIVAVVLAAAALLVWAIYRRRKK